ncbi:MAG: TAT-variant-translocated molybdopterin oxidoreductase, partial [Candidatus Zixiibacteriota bacterium]
MSESKNKDRAFWRSLDQLADTPEFREFVEREFPQGASEMDNDWSRRNFLTLMGASLALAGLAGCRRPEQKIVPYVKPPEEIIPGIPQYYATTMPFGTSAYGLIVESHEGRPTKIEGNAKHPSTLGASNAWIQASILGLYDPDRSQRVMRDGQESSWDDFVTFWRNHAQKYDAARGEGLAVLSESFASPTLAQLKSQFEKRYPKATWVTYEPISDENIYRGIELASGEAAQPIYDFSRADVILSLGCDFAMTESENITGAQGFIAGRRLESERDSMNRLYVIEAGFSTTGAMADHRLPVQNSRMVGFVMALSQRLRERGLKVPDFGAIEALPDSVKQWIEPLAEDLLTARGRSLVVAGRHQSPAVHAMVFALNEALGNVGDSVTFRSMADTTISNQQRLKQLAEDMHAGEVSTLMMIGGNPCYNAFADIGFAEALKKVETSVHLSLYHDQTSRESTWHIPQAHYLESWSDTRAVSGAPGVMQPLIAPLFGGVGEVEFLNLAVTGADESGYDIVRSTWRTTLPGSEFERKWQGVLHDGVFEAGTSRKATPRANFEAVREAVESELKRFGDAPGGTQEFAFAVSPSVYDGRYGNSGWLQELPHPITKLTWDNAALISPKTDDEQGVINGDMVKLSYQGHELEMPIWIVPGMADSTVVLELGYGQENLGRVADGVGFNTYALRTSDAMHYGTGLTMTKTGRTYPLASTQDHGSMEDRPHVREATLEEYRKHPDFAPEAVHHPPLVSMWEDHKYDKGYQWGMAIDLTACTGCNACTVACQSENNIPIVGKEQVSNGREMHWIRVDRYFTGDI